MDLRIDQVLKALDGEHSLPSIQERSWIPWLPPRDGVLRFRSTQFINFHGSERLDNKLNRKVEVLFKPNELGISPAAQVPPALPPQVSRKGSDSREPPPMFLLRRRGGARKPGWPFTAAAIGFRPAAR
jgi:hypothetical protein